MGLGKAEFSPQETRSSDLQSTLYVGTASQYPSDPFDYICSHVIMVHVDIKAQGFIFTCPIVRSSSLKPTRSTLTPSERLRGRSGVGGALRLSTAWRDRRPSWHFYRKSRLDH